MRSHPALALAALLLPVGLLAGCADDGEAAPTTPATTVSSSPDGASSPAVDAEYPTYVAIGDSYTSAPLVPETDPQDGCLRSRKSSPANRGSIAACWTAKTTCQAVNQPASNG